MDRDFLVSHTSSRQSPYTDNILSSGVIILGKTNTPEFGLMPTTEPIANGATRNPYNLDYSCGGSSGGAAAAVASRMVAAAQASDGGGSIRFPAAACNLFGLKPIISAGFQSGMTPKTKEFCLLKLDPNTYFEYLFSAFW